MKLSYVSGVERGDLKIITTTLYYDIKKPYS